MATQFAASAAELPDLGSARYAVCGHPPCLRTTALIVRIIACHASVIITLELHEMKMALVTLTSTPTACLGTPPRRAPGTAGDVIPPSTGPVQQVTHLRSLVSAISHEDCRETSSRGLGLYFCLVQKDPASLSWRYRSFVTKSAPTPAL